MSSDGWDTGKEELSASYTPTMVLESQGRKLPSSIPAQSGAGVGVTLANSEKAVAES